MIAAFFASTLGTLLGSLFEPLWWAGAFAASYPWKRGQPHIAWAGALLIGAAAMMLAAYPATMAFLPMYVGKFLIGPFTVLTLAAVQRMRRRSAVRRLPAGNQE